MKIEIKKFINAIERVKPGLGKSPLVPEAEMLILDPDHIYSFNGEIAVSYPFATGLNGGVSASEVHAYLSKLKADEVEIALNGNVVEFSAGKKSRAGVILHQDVKPYDLGLAATPDTKRFKLPADFTDGLGFALFSVARNLSHGVLTCVYVAEDVVMSCDNYRATRYRMKTSLAKDSKPLLIPMAAIRPLIEHAPVKFSIEQSAGWINFENKEGTVLSCRSPFDAYNAAMVGQLFDQKGQQLDIPPEINEALDRANIFADEGNAGFREVDVTVKKDHVIIRSEGARGWAEEELPSSYRGKEELGFMVSPELFRSISAHVKQMELTPGMILFKSDKFQHVISRLSNRSEASE